MCIAPHDCVTSAGTEHCLIYSFPVILSRYVVVGAFLEGRRRGSVSCRHFLTTIPPTNQPTNGPINQPKDQSINQRTNQSQYQSAAFNQSANEATNRVFAEDLVGLAFLQSVSYIKPIPTHTRKYLLWEKVAHMPRFFLPIFSWVGLALGWGVRRFHDNIYTFSNPTEFGESQTPH